VVAVLLQAGANPFYLTSSGISPWYYAVASGQKKILDLMNEWISWKSITTQNALPESASFIAGKTFGEWSANLRNAAGITVVESDDDSDNGGMSSATLGGDSSELPPTQDTQHPSMHHSRMPSGNAPIGIAFPSFRDGEGRAGSTGSLTQVQQGSAAGGSLSLPWYNPPPSPSPSKSAASKRRSRREAEHVVSMLFAAVEVGDWHAVQELIKNGVDVSAVNWVGNTALHVALEGRLSQVAKVLIDGGASVKSVNAARLTPLHLACREGLSEVAALLLSGGAEVNARSSTGDHPLHLAVMHDYALVAQQLIDWGAVVNCTNLQGQTPLHVAAVAGSPASLKILLAWEALVDIATPAGLTALHYAIMKGSVDCVQALLTGGSSVLIKTPKGESCQGLASAHHHYELIPILEDAEEHCEEEQQQAQAQVQVQVQRQQQQQHSVPLAQHHMEQLNLGEGTDGGSGFGEDDMGGVDSFTSDSSRDGDSQSPESHEHALIASPRIAHLEMTASPEQTASAERMFRPIHRAAKEGNVKVLRELCLDPTVNINEGDHVGNTPLHHCVAASQISCAKVIMSCAATDYSKINELAETVLHVAARLGNKAMFAALWKKTPGVVGMKARRGLNCLHIAAWHGHSCIVQLICESEVVTSVINAVDADLRTPLHLAAFRGHDDCVRMLLAAEASHSMAAENGWMAVHFAAYAGHVACLEQLSAVGSSLLQPDIAAANTPLHLAVSRVRMEVIQFLLGQSTIGPCLAARNKAGETVFDGAEIEHAGEVMALLRSAAHEHGVPAPATDKCAESMSFASVGGHRGHPYINHAPLLNSHPLVFRPCPDRMHGHVERQEGYVAPPFWSSFHPEMLNSCVDPRTRKISKKDRLEYMEKLPSPATNDDSIVSEDFIMTRRRKFLRWRKKGVVVAGLPPLHKAAQQGDVQSLLTVIASLQTDRMAVNAVDTVGLAALHYAAEQGDPRCCALLLDAGANPSVVETAPRAFTPLHLAVLSGHVDVVQLLIDRGAVPSRIAGDGIMPIHLSIYSPSTRVMLPLLRSTVAPYHAFLGQEKHGCSALHLCVNHNKWEFLAALLSVASAVGGPALTRTLVSLATREGITPLHSACRQNFVECTRLLLASGADPNLPDMFGSNSMHVAAAYNAPNALLLCLAHGGDIEAKNKRGNSILEIAQTRKAAAVIALMQPLVLHEIIDLQAQNEALRKEISLLRVEKLEATTPSAAGIPLSPTSSGPINGQVADSDKDSHETFYSISVSQSG
jgi:ankyrin repeat protein